MDNHSCCHHTKKSQSLSKDIPTEGVYICPMHPQIRQATPGACPICGMTLELEVITGNENHSHELLDMTRRFWIALILTVPIFVLEMGGHLFNWPFAMSTASNWI